MNRYFPTTGRVLLALLLFTLIIGCGKNATRPYLTPRQPAPSPPSATTASKLPPPPPGGCLWSKRMGG